MGKLIVLEGLNGCGKGTHHPYIANFIFGQKRSNTVLMTREPNEFDNNGKLAREMLSSDGDPYINNLDAVEYFAKNRVAHNKIFNPLINKGIYVLSDRYWHSNFAFQHAQGIPYNHIVKANRQSRVPDLTLILDVPVEVALDRLSKRDGKNRRKFDASKDFMSNVRNIYLELGSILPNLIGDNSIVYINGDDKIINIQRQIKKVLKERLNI